MNESQIQADILSWANAQPDTRLFRNNVGQQQLDGGRFLRYGLMPGSADLIGWWQGRFLSVEVKTPTGRTTTAQDRWLAAVNAAGGVAIVARSVDDVRQTINQLRLRNMV